MTTPSIPKGELLGCPKQGRADGRFSTVPMATAFWAKVERRAEDECWLWRAARNGKGYGNFRDRSAHVVAYELANGPVPDGLTIDHLCADHGCVNPAHLEAVTLAENIRRHSAKRTHCAHGHLLEGDNVALIRKPDGTRRRCQTCYAQEKRDNNLRRRELRRAQRKAEANV